MKNWVRRNKNICFAAAVLVGLIMAWVINHDRPISVTNNGGRYLIQGIALSQGELNLGSSRGPMYPLVIALSYLFGGISFESAFWATQIIFLSALVLTVYFSHLLYGMRVALLTAVFLVTSDVLFDLTWQIGLRYLWPGLILLSFIFFVRACRSGSLLIFGASGIFIGMAIMTKESAWIYFGYPFLFLIFKEYRRKDYFFGILTHILGVILVVGGWTALFYLSRPGQLSISIALFGHFSPRMNMVEYLFGYPSFWGFVADALTVGPYNTYHFISQRVVFFPLAVYCLPILIWKGMKDRADRIFLLLLVPLLPYLFAFGIYQNHLRQIVLVLLLAPVVTARAAEIFLDAFSDEYEKTKRRRKISALVCLAIVLSLSFRDFTGFFEPPNLLYLLKGRVLEIRDRFRLLEDSPLIDVKPGGRFTPGIRRAARWINENIPPGENLCTGGMYDHGIIFYTKNNYRYDTTNCNNPQYHRLRTLMKTRKKYLIVGLTTVENKFQSRHWRWRGLIFALMNEDLEAYIRHLASSKKIIMKFEKDKVVFRQANSLISKVTRKIYSGGGVVILETIPGNTDKLLSGDRSFQWSRKTKENLLWLKVAYPGEYQEYNEYLKANGVILDRP